MPEAERAILMRGTGLSLVSLDTRDTPIARVLGDAPLSGKPETSGKWAEAAIEVCRAVEDTHETDSNVTEVCLQVLKDARFRRWQEHLLTYRCRHQSNRPVLLAEFRTFAAIECSVVLVMAGRSKETADMVLRIMLEGFDRQARRHPHATFDSILTWIGKGCGFNAHISFENVLREGTKRWSLRMVREHLGLEHDGPEREAVARFISRKINHILQDDRRHVSAHAVYAHLERVLPDYVRCAFGSIADAIGQQRRG